MPAKEIEEVKEVKEVKDKNTRSGPVKNYKDLLVYKQAFRLALEISSFTKMFPREEQFELGRQLRRSARSVPANVVEGWANRNSPAEFKRHLPARLQKRNSGLSLLRKKDSQRENRRRN